MILTTLAKTEMPLSAVSVHDQSLHYYHTLTMALVASRYRAIVKPLELQTSDALLKTCCKAGCVWIVSMVFAIPEAVFSDLYSFSNPEKNVTFEACAPYPVSEKILQEVHSLVCFLVFYIVPLAVISVYYFLIARTLYKSTFNMPAEEHGHARKQVSYDQAPKCQFFQNLTC